MSYYNIEQWTVRNVAEAFRGDKGDSNGRKVIIPIFQRGLRWDVDKRKNFIDSLKKGYPFGSLLFANAGDMTYSVIDGLQRGSTVCDYVYNPLTAANFSEIDSFVLDQIREALYPGNFDKNLNDALEKCILEYLNEQKVFENVEIYDMAKYIFSKFDFKGEKFDCTEKIKEAFKPYFDKLKSKYFEVCGANVPIVVYTGPNELMSEIFNRINKEGIKLNDYEIYAAVWKQDKYAIICHPVLQAVVDKYMVLVKNGYNVETFDSTEILGNAKLTAFEYLFGLGKHWPKKYDCLRVSSDSSEDEVNEISFEIFDACINDSKKISSLDSKLLSIDINKLQSRIECAIEYVQDAIRVVSQFKGNKRKLTALHSKYQIVSLVAYTFRKMYDLKNLDVERPEWKTEKASFSKKLLQHYVADIISNDWHDGGGAKVYTSIKECRYDELITNERWNALLEGYYQKQLAAKQTSHFSSPTNADVVILNSIYVNIFTAGDHLSTKKFDIEHLATKEKMRELIAAAGNEALPVSCIANLCYLPEDINRGKRDKTIYEAKGMSMSIADVEAKFSFTQGSDFDWIHLKYDASSAPVLQQNFKDFLEKRFSEIKKRFLATMN